MQLQMDDDDLEDVVMRAEELLGQELFRNYSGPQFHTVKDFAEAICRQMDLKESTAPCPCIAEYSNVCEALKRSAPDVRSEVNPRSEIVPYLGARPEEGWRKLCGSLGMEAPARVIDGGWGLLFVFLFALQCVLPFFCFGSIWWNIPGSLVLSVFETLLIHTVLRPWLPQRRPAHFRTVADLVSYCVLYPLIRGGIPARAWTCGDVRLLARMLFAEATGKSVREIKLRARIAA